MSLWLLLSLVVATVWGQHVDPVAWNQQWSLTAESGEYFNSNITLKSMSSKGVILSWSNTDPTCLPVVCIKRLLKPIPERSQWTDGHCTHMIGSYPSTIYPLIGYYHTMIYREKLCDGTLNMSGKWCNDSQRIFDGEHCELPNVGMHIRDLNKGLPISLFVIPPQQGAPDVGEKTFIFNNYAINQINGTLWVNASGILSIRGRYGAITQLTAPIQQDYNYAMTKNDEQIKLPNWKLMRVGVSPPSPTSDDDAAAYGFLHYITLINEGNSNITVYNLAASINKCQDGTYGKDCKPRYGDRTLDTFTGTKTPFFNDPPTSDSPGHFQFVPMDIKLDYSSPTLLIQNFPSIDKRYLPNVYIRQRGIPDPDEKLYDIMIPGKSNGVEKSMIYYEFGQMDIRPEGLKDWYIAFEVPKDQTLPPIVVTIGQQCAADCSHSGDCINHICSCHDGFTNYDCSVQLAPSDEIILPPSWRYSLFTLAMVAPIVFFFILKRHLNNLVSRPTLASQGLGLGPGHVLGSGDVQDGRRWQ